MTDGELVAISNSRLRQVTAQTVTFAYKDYRQGGREKELTLPGQEFARRFVQHVLPRGLVRVRHSGLLANRGREAKLALSRRLLRAWAVEVVTEDRAALAPRCCAVCGQGWMVVVQLLPAGAGGAVALCGREDSS
jgi:hypothetical protein